MTLITIRFPQKGHVEVSRRVKTELIKFEVKNGATYENKIRFLVKNMKKHMALGKLGFCL